VYSYHVNLKEKTCSFLGDGVNSCQILNVFFFFFFELYLAKYLQRGRGESQEHLMSNKSGVSIYDYGFHTVTIRINSKFEAGIPGLHSWEKKRTLHFNTTSNEQIIFSKSVSNLPSSFFTD